MTTLTKSILAFVGAVVIAGAIYGAYQYPQVVAVGSPAGTTFNSAKVAAINITPSSASATSTSIFNGDASDRIVQDAFVTCTAAGSVQTYAMAGVATWQWVLATTSTSAPTVIGNTNHIADLVVATSTTDDSYTASSTSPVLVVNRRWKAGSYLTAIPNATSSTAVCQVGVHYLAQ